MAKINWGRVLLGGLVAGLIINAAEYLVNGVILQAKWADAMKGIGDALGGAKLRYHLRGPRNVTWVHVCSATRIAQHGAQRAEVWNDSHIAHDGRAPDAHRC